MRILYYRRKSGDGKSKLNRPLSGIGRAAELSKQSQRQKRPLSGSYFGRSAPLKPSIFKSPLDLAIGEESNHPVLFEDIDEPSSGYSDLEPLEPISPVDVDEVEEQFLAQESLDKNSSDDTSTPTEVDSGDDDVFSRSSEFELLWFVSFKWIRTCNYHIQNEEENLHHMVL